MTEIVVRQMIDAPPSTVYRYLTESEKWRLWQGVEATIDSRPGGPFSIVMANGMNAHGEFVELVPGEKVSFTWGWADNPAIPPGSTVVEISLEAVDDKTLVVLTHRNLPAGEAEMHRLGWSHYALRLAAVASGSDPGPDPGVA